MIRYDRVIVGAESSGWVLAAQLSEDPQRKVLVLEAGTPDRFLWLHIPIGYGKTISSYADQPHFTRDFWNRVGRASGRQARASPKPRAILSFMRPNVLFVHARRAMMARSEVVHATGELPN